MQSFLRWKNDVPSINIKKILDFHNPTNCLACHQPSEAIKAHNIRINIPEVYSQRSWKLTQIASPAKTNLTFMRENYDYGDRLSKAPDKQLEGRI